MELFDKLKSRLSDEKALTNNLFGTLGEISKVQNADSKLGRELVIRALEKRYLFGELTPLLDQLVRAVGLFPYIDPLSLSSRDKIAYQFNKPSSESDVVFHREQADVYRALMRGENIVLSAPTSFGKSLLIDKLIESGRYNDILIIVPTIALIDELRKKSLKHTDFRIITHNDQERGKRNLFILTQERAVDRLDIEQLDLLIIDEFYKLDPSSEEGGRASTLNIALYKYAKISSQIYLLGPNINKVPVELGEKFNCRFYRTEFNTVASELIRLDPTPTREDAFLKLCESFDEPTLVYCKSPKQANDVLELLCKSLPELTENNGISGWVSDSYHDDWAVASGYRKGVSIHHGQIPRSLAQLNVRLFNEEKLKFLICTSSLIEGVNTAAKNVVIYEGLLAKNKLEYFTFKNIQGRAGRMFQHFVGRLYIFDDAPEEKVESVDIPAATRNETTSDSLLVQFDERDMNDYLSDRFRVINEQEYLPMHIIKELSGVEPSKLVALAKDISENIDSYHAKLDWTNPDWKQLLFCCQLSFRHFLGRNTKYIHSAGQLAFWLNRLKRHHATKSFIDDVLENDRAINTVNEAIESSFDFQRRWASFLVPKWFMAISVVQHHIFSKQGLSAGDYSSYVMRVESLFEAPEIVGLDEYGLPLPLGQKLSKSLSLNKGMDEAIKSLKELAVDSSDLTEFEQQMVEDIVENLA